MKIEPEHEQNSKISSRGWRAWKNWFFKVIFWLRSIFGHFLRSQGSKNDRSPKSYFYKKSVFSCSSTSQRNFWILFMLWLYFHDWFLKLYRVIAKFCDLGGHSYLVQKCSPGLYWPKTGWPSRIKKSWSDSIKRDRGLISSLFWYTFWPKTGWPSRIKNLGATLSCRVT